MTINFPSKFFLAFFLALCCLLLTGCGPTQKATNKGGEEKMALNNKVLMIIAPSGFRDEEYQRPRAVFENADLSVTVASKGVKTAKGMLGMTVEVDKDLSEVAVGDFGAIVFVGGSGSSVYFNDQAALNLAKEAFQQGKVIGAICIAPSILANAGVLKGKKATCFSSEAGNLQAKGAIYTGEAVTVDGNLVTADGPGAAEEFGEKIVELLI